MAKSKSQDYRQGYEDCKAVLLSMIQEASERLASESLQLQARKRRLGATRPNDIDNPYNYKENIKALRAREAELRRIRAMIKSLKIRG